MICHPSTAKFFRPLFCEVWWWEVGIVKHDGSWPIAPSNHYDLFLNLIVNNMTGVETTVVARLTFLKKLTKLDPRLNMVFLSNVENLFYFDQWQQTLRELFINYIFEIDLAGGNYWFACPRARFPYWKEKKQHGCWTKMKQRSYCGTVISDSAVGFTVVYRFSYSKNTALNDCFKWVKSFRNHTSIPLDMAYKTKTSLLRKIFQTLFSIGCSWNCYRIKIFSLLDNWVIYEFPFYTWWISHCAHEADLCTESDDSPGNLIRKMSALLSILLWIWLELFLRQALFPLCGKR